MAAVLAPPGAKGMAGFVINLSTGEIRLRDSSVNTQAGPRALFAQGLFAMADTRSTKEAVKVVADMMDRPRRITWLGRSSPRRSSAR